MNTFGFLFEAMVDRDLKIYADIFNAKCYHYQDYQDKEIDSVIELENGDLNGNSMFIVFTYPLGK